MEKVAPNNCHEGCGFFQNLILPHKSGEQEAIIWIDPSKKYSQNLPFDQRSALKSVKVRAVRMESPDSIILVLLTSLLDMTKIGPEKLIVLYFKRWEVEVYYRDEKTFLKIEKFHSRTPDGIRQELFAIMVMALISRMLMFVADETTDGSKGESEPQFTNAIMTIASDMAIFVSKNPLRTLEILEEILTEIRRVRYYRSKAASFTAQGL